MCMCVCMCGCDPVVLMFRDKVVKRLDAMFPGLFSYKKKKGHKTFQFLMLPILLRRDIRTYDCLRQSDIMERKADTSLFPVNTKEELREWAWVCVHLFQKIRLVPCILIATRSSRMESEGIGVESEARPIRQ